MADFKWFKSRTTGKTGKFPARYGDLWPDLVEIDPKDGSCIPCKAQPVENVELEDITEFDDVEDLSYEDQYDYDTNTKDI